MGLDINKHWFAFAKYLRREKINGGNERRVALDCCALKTFCGFSLIVPSHTHTHFPPPSLFSSCYSLDLDLVHSLWLNSLPTSLLSLMAVFSVYMFAEGSFFLW